MWEISVSINRENSEFLRQAMAYLSKDIALNGGVCVMDGDDERAYLSLACEDLHKPRLKRLLSEQIHRMFLDDYKAQFIRQNISQFFTNPINFNAFVRALVSFDTELDAEIVKNEFKLKDGMCLDGFYNFKLKELKRRWREVCELASDNAFYLGFNDTYLELMRFLISTIDCKSQEIIIERIENGFSIFDCDKMESIFASEDSLLPSIINLSPKIISIYESSKIPAQIMNLIQSLYEKKIQMLKV